MHAIDMHAHFGIHDRSAGGLATESIDHAARLLGAKIGVGTTGASGV